MGQRTCHVGKNIFPIEDNIFFVQFYCTHEKQVAVLENAKTSFRFHRFYCRKNISDSEHCV